MKKTLSSCLVATSMTLLAGSASAALFVSDLSGLGAGNDLDGYVDGSSAWSVSELPDGGGANGFLAYGANVAGSPGFQIGVANDIPAGGPTPTSFFANHAVGISLISATAQPTLVQTTFFIVDSDPNTFADRNDYSIGIYDGVNRLFEINFQAASNINPDGPNSLWNVSWTHGNTTTPTGLGVLEGGPYDLTIAFGANGLNTDFHVNLNGSNETYFGGTIPNHLTANITDFRVSTDVGGGNDWGSGVIGITGVSVIPEPSTALFFGLSSLALLRRRRA